MADDVTEPNPSQDTAVVVEKKAKFSIVWLIPLVAAALGIWLFVKAQLEAGVPITLTFETADGLEAGKTKIRFKEVEVGLVDAIRVSDDATHVVLDATIARHAEHYLKADTRFWVVRPRITTEGISGLGTLLSGAYITLEPGNGKMTTAYEGLEKPPILNKDAPGHEYVLEAEELGSVGVGSPIYYRGLRVGEVLSYELDEDLRGVTMKVFINAPHHTLVWQETQFWNASGIDVSVDANGMNIQTASLEAMLIGGIQFEMPLRVTKGTPAKNDHVFKLHRSKRDIDPHYSRRFDYVTYFRGSVRGLSVGAPVEFRGLTVGEVTKIGVEFNRETLEILIPVTFAFEPERLLSYDARESDLAKTREEAEQRMNALIGVGLRAQLKTGSLITGQLFVDLDLHPDTEASYAKGRSSLPEVPALSAGGLEEISASVNQVLAKVNNLPVERLLENAADAVETLGKILNKPEIAEMIEKLNNLPIDRLVSNAADSAESVNKILNGPELQEILSSSGDLINDLRTNSKQAGEALASVEKTLIAVQGTLRPDSKLQYALALALKEVAGAARSVNTLTAYLERHPESLLKGKSGN